MAMLVRAPYILLLFLVVCCWFRHNAAIPFIFNSSISHQVQDIVKNGIANIPNQWINALQFRSKRDAKPTSNDHNDSDLNVNNQARRKMIKNRNINLNFIDRHHRHYKPPGSYVPTAAIHDLEYTNKEDELMNCTSGKKENQRYSSSFVKIHSRAKNCGNNVEKVEKEFDESSGNSKAKKTTRVHAGEDITVCWIETTTITENKTVRPRKRLVIREYTISFENSATIPDNYVDCKRLDGEITTNDPEIGQTALFDVIEENTKVSKTANFTATDYVGDVVIWQHKKVKCGVGPVVTKSIIEWKDGSENLKKRVDIKVSPKMHKFTRPDDPCTEEPKDDGPKPESSTFATTVETVTEAHDTTTPVEPSTSTVTFDTIDFESSSVTMGKTDFEPEITTTTPSFIFTESTERTDKPHEILNLTVTPPTTESLSTPKGVPPESSEEVIVVINKPILPKIESTTSSPVSSEVEFNSCENPEDCVYVDTSKSCDEFGNCDKKNIISCESGQCFEESFEVTTQTPYTTPLIEINNISTAETRRSTLPSTTTTIVPRHKLSLKIKILVDHFNDKKEKQNLIEIEKNLWLNENPYYHDHPDLFEQLRSLNNSVNVEIVNALLNCTSLANLTTDANFVSKESDAIGNMLKKLKLMYSSKPEKFNIENSNIKHTDAGSQYLESNEEYEFISQRRRRRSLDAISKIGNINKLKSVILNLDDSPTILKNQIVNTKKNIPSLVKMSSAEKKTNEVHIENEGHTTEEENETEIVSTTENIDNNTNIEAILKSLEGTRADVSVGLQNIISQLEKNIALIDEIKRMTKKDLSDDVADPKDDEIHSRKTREIAEEVGHWSNERTGKAPMGGNLRSITEFTLYKECCLE